MKKISFIVLVLIIASTCLADETLYFVGVENVRPFAYQEKGQVTGYDVDLFMEIARLAELKVRVELMPFKRSWVYLQDGAVDGTFMVYYRKDREEKILYSSRPIHTFKYHIFVKKGREFPFTGLKDLYGKRVGNQMGFTVTPEFESAVTEKCITLEEATDIDMNIRKLDSGRVDCYISTPRLVKNYTDSMGITDQIAMLPRPIVPDKKMYVALSLNSRRIKDKKAVMARIDKAMKAMEKNRFVDTMEAKYFK